MYGGHDGLFPGCVGVGEVRETQEERVARPEGARGARLRADPAVGGLPVEYDLCGGVDLGFEAGVGEGVG